MRVLIACEFSGTVRRAFRDRGHDAWGCDILPAADGDQHHFTDDCLNHINDGWDMMIAHPPCTYLSHAGIGYFNEERWGDKARERKVKRDEALKFFMALFNAPIAKVCVENPIGHPNKAFRKPDQVIHPYFFGDNHKKRTALWLRGLPKLFYTDAPDLFATATKLPEPKPLYIHERKPSKHYKGGEIKKRYFVDAGAKRCQKTRSITFPGIAAAMAQQWG